MSIGDQRVLAVIPARGGSKGIPRKNVRLLAGNPLISYSIENCLGSSYIDQVVVSTEDDEISHIAEITGAEVLIRPARLAGDEVPLDPVVDYTVREFEKVKNREYGIVLTIQPTSPLLSPLTIDRGLERFADNQVDTMLTVVNRPHLSWTEKGGEYIPRYRKRVNRQYLPPNYVETGGMMITRRECITSQSRFGEKVDLLEIPEREAVDIDDVTDLWVAEKYLTRKKILIRVDGYREIGLGHIYRTLLLANRLIDHQLLFVSRKEHRMGIDLIREKNYPVREFGSDSEFMDIVDQFSPHIIINDILDTTNEYMERLKEADCFTVNFEDMGEGAKYADIVINALYEEKYLLDNHYWGKDYYCLREEFHYAGRNRLRPEVEKILITFGGTDSHDYTGRIISLIAGLGLKVKVVVILGLGYPRVEELKREMEGMDIDIDIRQNVNRISRYMKDADIAFTSAGRTVYELAAMGTPTVVLAQNNRELRHTFAGSENGIINLKLGYQVPDEEIEDTLMRLINDFGLRRKCSRLMLNNDLKSGVDNILEIIFKKYRIYSEGMKS